jgi:hypothetical protein
MLQRNMYKSIFSDVGLCFVCLQEEDFSNLVQPCGCKGHLKYAHEECFLRWHKETKLIKCPFCEQPFGFRPKTKGLFGGGGGILDTDNAAVGEVFQGTKLTRLETFKKISFINLKENHPLVSCLLIPPADSFTRPQRLTVLFTTMFSSLFGSALVMASNAPETLEEKVIAGVVTAVVVQPVAVMFKNIFTIGQGPKESAMSEIRKDNRETPWMRQERMLLERRKEKAIEKAKSGDPRDIIWMGITGQMPKPPPAKDKLYSKGMLDKLGEKNPILDACKCVGWVCAIGYLLGVGGIIVIYSMRFTPDQNNKWLGMAWMNIGIEWACAKPIGAVVAGVTAALKGDIKETLIFIGQKLEYLVVKLKQWAEANGHDRLARILPVDSAPI